ncbi:MAG: hypothetical protein ACKV2Q_16265 [Planctomycetaceae bacterium]
MSWPKRLAVECVLAFHGIVAAAWWWLTPGGFPLGHSRFWMNRVWPLVLLAIAVLGVWALARRRYSTLKLTLLSVAAMWIAFATSARIVFPVSAPGLWWYGLLIGGAGFTLLARRDKPAANRRAEFVSAVVTGVMLGSFVPWALRGPDPSTRPIGDRAETISASNGSTNKTSDVPLNPSVNVRAESGEVLIRKEPYRLEIDTFLGFAEISPDRCWSILNPTADQPLPRRHHSLAVSSTDSHITEITATSTLNEATYSHINSFCRLTLTGHRRLFLRFSPCPNVRIEVLPADYPTGRPARLAYRTASRFLVVEASSGEKGPFRELANGSLLPHEPISLFMEDEDREIGSVTFDDWAAQASTEPSPTAGWGLPQNAIEFQLEGDDPSDSADIWLTLAATAVGRGWDTVGHSPGTYRNRMEIKLPNGNDPASLKTKE